MPEQLIRSPFFTSKMQHLVRKGAVYILDPKYFEHFLLAFRLERNAFAHRPYSYGLHYNCNQFVTAVLKRLLDLTWQ
jgi:hypothetical protein